MRWLLAVCFIAGVANAEAPWLAGKGRAGQQVLAGGFAGTRAVGVSLAVPDGAEKDRSAVGDIAWNWRDRVGEFRLVRLWELTKRRAATLSAAVGGSGYFVPEGRTDLGLGPQALVSLGLGGERFSFDVSLQTAAEVFVQGGVRFPQRLAFSVSGAVGPVTATVSARAGVDFIPNEVFRIRGEAVLSVGWLGPW